MSGTHLGHSWRYFFGTMLNEHKGLKMRPAKNGRSPIASNRTREIADQGAMRLLAVLRDELGFKVMKPANLAPKHAQAWAVWLNRQRQEGKLLPATLASYASTLRKVFRWAGRPGLVAVLDTHLERATTARRLAAEVDKSFEGAGVDVDEAIVKVWHIEPWVAMVMLVEDVFGERRREGVMFSPIRDIDLVAGVVRVSKGAKGGRKRAIPMSSATRLPIRNAEERAACEQLLEFARWRNLAEGRPVNAHTSLAPAALTQKQALDRYSRVMQMAGLTKKDAGVTGHGLRVGFVCQRLQDAGITPVVKGGSGRHADPLLDRLYHLMTSEATGHSRVAVLGAYAGSPGVQERVLASEYLRGRGLLLPGRDARSIDINAQRITDYLASVREQMARETAAGKSGTGGNQKDEGV